MTLPWPVVAMSMAQRGVMWGALLGALCDWWDPYVKRSGFVGQRLMDAEHLYVSHLWVLGWVVE